MLKRCWLALAGLGLLLSFQVSAIKYVPISVGDIMVIIPINEAPEAKNDYLEINEIWGYCSANSVSSTSAYCDHYIDVLSNDVEHDGESLNLLSVSGASHAQLLEIDAATGHIRYIPATSFFHESNGADSFTYVIEDEEGNQVTGSVAVSVNRAPIVSGEVLGVVPKEHCNFDAVGDRDYCTIVPSLVSNDYDPEGDNLDAVINEIYSHGENVAYGPGYNMTWNRASQADTLYMEVWPGKCLFTSNTAHLEQCNYRIGNAERYYRVRDSKGAISKAVKVELVYGLSSPVAEDDVSATLEDVNVTINVLQNDSDSVGNGLTVTAVSGATLGLVTIQSDNTLLYTPSHNANGQDTLTYTVREADGDTATGQVQVIINSVNDLPTIAQSNSQIISFDQIATFSTGSDLVKSFNALAFATDVEGQALTLSQVSFDDNALLNYFEAPSISGQNINLVHKASACNPCFEGTINLNVQVSDGISVGSGVLNVRFNDKYFAPIATSSSATVNEDAAVNINLTGTADSGHTITSWNIVTQPANGTLTGAGANRTYTPDTNYEGLDSFVFKVFDGASYSQHATVSITITGSNDAPVITNSASIPTAVTSGNSYLYLPQVSDPENHSYSFTSAGLPSWASFDNATGQLSGTPETLEDVTYSGISIEVTDSEGLSSNIGPFSIDVLGVNHPPTALPLAVIETNEDTSVSVTLSGTDPESRPLTFNIVTAPQHGMLNGTGEMRTYAPNTNYEGSDSFVFNVFDGASYSQNVAVNITIEGVNDAPVITNSASIPTAVTSGDSYSYTPQVADPENHSYSFTITGLPSWASFNTATGHLSGTPDALENVAYSGITITVTDSAGLFSSIGPFSIEVLGVNHPPTALPLALVETNEDTSVSLTLSGTDPENQPLTYHIVSAPKNGVLTGTGANLTYTPAANFHEDSVLDYDDFFTYRVNDGKYDSEIITVDISVIEVNDPLTGNITINGTPTEAQSLAANTSEIADPDGIPASGAFSYQWLRNAQDIVGATQSTYLLTAQDVDQQISLRVTVTDENDNIEVKTSDYLNISARNTAPTISGTPKTSINADETYHTTVTAGDVDGDTLTFSASNLPDWMVLDAASGVLTGVPLTSHVGNHDNIIISVSDGIDTVNLPAFDIEVLPKLLDISWLNHAPSVLGLLIDTDIATTAAPEQDLVGELKGQVQVDGGAFNYSLPISLPPGINGQAPSVSLAYSSQSGMGNAGYGWSLSAGAAISRCASIYVIDGEVRNVQRTDNDNLCLNGQRLINITDDHGASGAQYKTERDSGVLVELAGDDFDSANSYFVVHHRDGSRQVFGEAFVPVNTESTVNNAPLSWHLSQVADMHGNLIDYQYNITAGEILLTNIYYTGRGNTLGDRRVEFVYGSGSEVDTRTSYGYGYFTQQTHRLTDINLSIAGTAQDSYSLNYSTPAVAEGDMTLLESVDHNLDSGALTVEFAYNQRHMLDTQVDPFFEPLSEVPVAEDNVSLIYQPYQPVGDYDGDGFPELRVFDQGAGNQWALKFRMSSTGEEITPINPATLPDNAGFEALYGCDPTDDPFCALYGFDVQANLFQGEMDADFNGTQEFVYVNQDMKVAFGSYVAGDDAFSSLPATNIDATCQVNRSSVHVGILGCQSFALDINQDGRTDLLVANGEPTNRTTTAWLRNSDDNGFTAIDTHNDWFLKYQLMDIDGDGQQELVTNSTLDPTDWHWYDIALINDDVIYTKRLFPFTQNAGARGDHILDRAGYTRGTHSFWMDTNGDGLKDLVALHDEDVADPDPTEEGYIPEILNWYVSFNMGAGNFAPLTKMTFSNDDAVLEALSSNNGADNRNGNGALTGFMNIVDFNGDGREDFLVPSDGKVMYECVTFDPRTPNIVETCDPDNGQFAGWDKRHHKRDIWTWKVWQSNFEGNGFTEIALDDSLKGALSTTGLVDLDTDGQLDFVSNVGFNAASGWRYYDPMLVQTTDIPFSGERVFYRNRNEFKRHLMSGVTTSMGQSLAVEYHPLGKDMENAQGIYRVNQLNSAFPYVNFGSSMVVVKALYTNNGLEDAQGNNAMNQQTYQYEDARFHLQGRGFQGFGNITVTNVTGGTTSSTDYYQDFPMTGQVNIQTVRETNGDNLLSQVSNTLPNTVASNGIYCPYSGATLSQSFDRNSGYVITENMTTTGYNTDLCLATSVTRTSRDYDDIVSALPGQQTASGHWIEHSSTQTTQYATLGAGDATQWPHAVRKHSVTGSAQVTYAADKEGVTLPAQTAKGTTQTFTYVNHALLPDSVTTSENHGGITTLTQHFTYDDFGHVNRITHTGTDITGSRWQETHYTADGYFVANTRNSQWGSSANAVSLSDYVARYGLPQTSTDANGIVTNTTYNDLGLPLSVTVTQDDVPVAPEVYTQYQWCVGCGIDNAKFSVTTGQSGSPAQTVYSDSVGRQIVTEVDTFDGSLARDISAFDARGNLVQNRNPGGGRVTYAGFDVLGRPATRHVDKYPQNFTSTYTYNGLQTAISVTDNANSKTLEMSRTYNSRKGLMRTTDANAGTMYYAYDGLNNPTLIRDVEGNEITASFNDFGHKRSVDDPNQGRTLFRYNALGELIQQTDANNTVTVLELDNLGRVFRKTQGSDVSTWRYDTRFKGAVDQETRHGLTRDYHFDEVGRLVNQTDRIAGVTAPWEQYWRYDAVTGRLLGHQDASGLITAFKYNNLGYKTKDYIPDSAGNEYRVLATFDDYDVNGALTRQTFSSSVEQQFNYHTQSGQADWIMAHSTAFQNIDYEYDNFGNLAISNNLRDEVLKAYQYDNLHRLDNATVTINGMAGTIDYDFSAAGNIRIKEDYGSHYLYGNSTKSAGGNAGPNALRQMLLNNNTVTFNYDNAGNLTSGNGLSIEYDGNHHTTSVTRNGAEITFEYDANGQRYQQVKEKDDTTTTTHYIGSVEHVIETGTRNSEFYRIYIGNHTIINKVISGSNNSPQVSHTLRDRLGSVSVVISADGGNMMEFERRDYDAFGKAITLPNNPDLPVLFYATNRGFTDHEHLLDVELIHMNGRAYDYNTGRFLSVDPFVQAPSNSQSVNPYSYIMNNPLSGTDPTGYRSCGTPNCKPSKSPEDKRKIKNHNSACKAKGFCETGLSSGALNGGKHTRTGSKDDVGENAQFNKLNGNSNRSGFEVNNPDLDQVIRNKLSDKEKVERLKKLDVISIDSTLIAEHLRENETFKVEHFLKNIVLTDEGSALMDNYNGLGIDIVLCETCESARSFDAESRKDKIQINIHGSDYETAEGTNTFVQLSGMRTLAHELVHAGRNQFIFNSLHEQNETEAVQRTNIIMKQHFLRIGFPELSGARNWYGKSRNRLPVGATLKENFGDGYEH